MVEICLNLFSRELDNGNNKISCSQIKLLKILLESKEINKQLVIVVCQSLIGACFFFLEIRLRLNFAENPIFSTCVFVETDLV